MPRPSICNTFNEIVARFRPWAGGSDSASTGRRCGMSLCRIIGFFVDSSTASIIVRKVCKGVSTGCRRAARSVTFMMRANSSRGEGAGAASGQAGRASPGAVERNMSSLEKTSSIQVLKVTLAWIAASEISYCQLSGVVPAATCTRLRKRSANRTWRVFHLPAFLAACWSTRYAASCSAGRSSKFSQKRAAAPGLHL